MTPEDTDTLIVLRVKSLSLALTMTNFGLTTNYYLLLPIVDVHIY